MSPWLIKRFQRKSRLLSCCVLSLACINVPALACSESRHVEQSNRVLSLGGMLTEIVFALGAGDQLIGVDNSSTYPAAAKALPQVGYYRNLSLEGLTSLHANLILATDQAGPAATIRRLQQLGSPVITLPSAPTILALEQRIRSIAMHLKRSTEGEQLIKTLHQEMAALAPKPAMAEKAIIVLSRSGNLEGAGKDTAADAVLRLAGGDNLLAKQARYKPLSAEVLVLLAPDVIVTTERTVASLGGLEKFSRLPGLRNTPAAKSGRIVVMDDLLLLGFGPRLPEALRQLRTGLTR